MSPTFPLGEFWPVRSFAKCCQKFTEISFESAKCRREMAAKFRRYFTRTMDEIRRNSFALLLHSTVPMPQERLERSQHLHFLSCTSLLVHRFAIAISRSYSGKWLNGQSSSSQLRYKNLAQAARSLE